ncbi:terminase small subunit, partial [Escherichia coli]
LSVQRRFPELENRHVDFLKRDIIKAMNKAAALDELILVLYGSAHRQGLQILPGSIHLVILTIFTLQSEIMRLV